MTGHIAIKNISNIKVNEDTHIELNYQARKKRISLQEYVREILEIEMSKKDKK